MCIRCLKRTGSSGAESTTISWHSSVYTQGLRIFISVSNPWAELSLWFIASTFFWHINCPPFDFPAIFIKPLIKFVLWNDDEIGYVEDMDYLLDCEYIYKLIFGLPMEPNSGMNIIFCVPNELAYYSELFQLVQNIEVVMTAPIFSALYKEWALNVCGKI